MKAYEPQSEAVWKTKQKKAFRIWMETWQQGKPVHRQYREVKQIFVQLQVDEVCEPHKKIF